MEAEELLAGRYRLEHIAGNGAMALVFRAHDTVLDRTVAIKYLQFYHRRHPAAIERFAREARAAAKIVSPYVVSVYDVGEGDERPFIVMEYVDGKSLDEILRDAPLPLETALHFGEQAARGLAAAHELGIVHRDVKPGNLVVDERGWLRITDFGLAHGPNDDGEAEIPGALVGSAYYVPPEQARDGDDATPASDCYGLGVVLYEMLSGSLPFDGKSPETIAYAHLAAPPKPLAQARPDIPAEVCTLVDALLEKDPEKRPADASAIADRLSEAAQRERAEH